MPVPPEAIAQVLKQLLLNTPITTGITGVDIQELPKPDGTVEYVTVPHVGPIFMDEGLAGALSTVIGTTMAQFLP